MIHVLRRLAPPPRYMVLVLGSLLFLLSSDGTVFLDGATATPLMGLGTFLAGLLSMVCLFAAVWQRATPFSDTAVPDGRAWPAVPLLGLRRRLPHVPARLRHFPVRTFARYLTLAVLSALTMDALALFVVAAYAACFVPASSAYFNDVISFTHVNAEVALAGGNPYTDDALFPATLRRFPKGLATPLRRGAFGTGYAYPETTTIRAVERAYLADPARYATSFDPATLHSYPALSFLLYAPLLAIGLPNILLPSVLLFVAIIFVLARLAPPGMRGWAALIAFANVPMIGLSLLLDTEIVCFVFLLSAWHLRKRVWLSGLLLGLGCAFKQYCWLFAPFFLLDMYRREGWRGATRYGAIAAAAFLLPNLPYILMNPAAWTHSVLLPATDPLFPMGMGIEAISAGHLLPFAPPPVYMALEVLAYGGALWCQWRWADQLGAGVLLLALVPLYFAFRSPTNYFAIAPWLALYALNVRYWNPGALHAETASAAVSLDTKGARDAIHAHTAQRSL